ncbi:MAG: hypothetical protein ACO1OX_15125 [Novosphingobium sp.]
MTNATKPRPQVLQAQRFADSLTYNAWTALSRVRHLMADAEEIEAVLEAEQNSDDPPLRPWFGFEVISYYIVGLVTCLEWHARTRLSDLYTYRPETIEKKALDGRVSSEALSQLIKAGVTVPHYISASISVGSPDDYLTVLQTLFDGLGIAKKVVAIVQPPAPYATTVFGEPYVEPAIYETLTRLFEARHSLVHEIGLMRMSSPAISENWGVQDVLAMGRSIITVMRAFERVLTEEAPPDFPNLLDMRGDPVDERIRLGAAADAIAARISAKIEIISQSRGIDERDAWESVNSGLGDIGAFLATSDLFRQRFTNPGLALAKLELEYRLKILSAVEEALGNPRLVEEQ